MTPSASSIPLAPATAASPGRPRDNATDRWLVLFDFGSADAVADFQSHLNDAALGLGHKAINNRRHRAGANVVFCDWHVEKLATTDDGLAGVGLSKGLQS